MTKGTEPGSAREILRLAVPALGALAAEPLLGLVDTAMVGSLGAVPLAALGAANGLLALVLSGLIFLEYGSTARLGRRFGAGETEMLAREAMQMAWIALVMGLGLGAMLWIYADRLLLLMGVSDEVLQTGTIYLRIRVFGIVPGLLIRVGNGVFRGLQDTRRPLLIVVAMNLLNGLLDWLLIFGLPALKIPALGIRGAAWASVAASWLGAGAFAWFLAGPMKSWLPRFSLSLLKPHWQSLSGLLALSRDLLIRTLGLQAALFTGTKMAAGLGTNPLAAHQVAWQLWAFLALVLDSLAIAGQALVARFLGQGSIESARRAGNRILRWSVVMGLAASAFFWLGADLLPKLFTQDPGVLGAIASIFFLLTWMQIPNALLFALDGLLIGASDMAFLRNSMALLGLAGCLLVWAGHETSHTLLGVWLGISVFMLLRTLVMGARWLSGRWAG